MCSARRPLASATGTQRDPNGQTERACLLAQRRAIYEYHILKIGSHVMNDRSTCSCADGGGAARRSAPRKKHLGGTPAQMWYTRRPQQLT